MNCSMTARKLYLLFVLISFSSDVFAWLDGQFQKSALHGVLYVRSGGSSFTDDPSPVIESSHTSMPTRALVLMDCFCPYHGLYLAHKIQEAYPDVALVFTLSNYMHGFLRFTDPSDRWDAAKIPNAEYVEIWKEKLNGLRIVGVYCESDSGLEDAEWLRENLQADCQDNPPCLEARRHKYYMNQKVGNDGLKTVEQKLCSSLEEALEFGQKRLGNALANRIVIKPHRGVATESVHLCSNAEEIEHAWNHIVSTKVFGAAEQHSSVLAQEFLSGIEYAVDVVARDGEYKIAAIWRYEKRPANGAPFCYFRTKLVDNKEDGNVEAVVEYIKGALKSLGVMWGLSHNEVIVTDDRGPVLVEINCRQHNMDFSPLTMACIGYNALDMTLTAFLGSQDEWDTIPDFPSLRAAGCMVHLVNYSLGKLKQVNYLVELDDLSSVVNWEVYEEFQMIGEEIKPTIDIKTDAGWIQLVNTEAEQLEQDYSKILGWMPSMFDVFVDE